MEAVQTEENQNHLIYAFRRGGGTGEEIQIALRKFKGKTYIDLRIWFQAKGESVFRPTKKGVFFPMDQITEFRKGFERLSKATERLGPEPRTKNFEV